MTGLTCISFIYRPCFLMDGNFKGDHIKSKPGTIDIPCGVSGEGFFVEKDKYAEHLSYAEDDPVVRVYLLPPTSGRNQLRRSRNATTRKPRKNSINRAPETSLGSVRRVVDGMQLLSLTPRSTLSLAKGAWS